MRFFTFCTVATISIIAIQDNSPASLMERESVYPSRNAMIAPGRAAMKNRRKTKGIVRKVGNAHSFALLIFRSTNLMSFILIPPNILYNKIIS